MKKKTSPFLMFRENKEPWPKGPGFGLPPKRTSMVFPYLRQSAGVMEWWSNGVMKGLIQVEIRAFAFSNTPVLQNSSQSLPEKSLNSDPRTAGSGTGPHDQVFDVE